jgi:hypothetical protein
MSINQPTSLQSSAFCSFMAHPLSILIKSRTNSGRNLSGRMGQKMTGIARESRQVEIVPNKMIYRTGLILFGEETFDL